MNSTKPNTDRNGKRLTSDQRVIVYTSEGDPLELGVVLQADGEGATVVLRVATSQLEIVTDQDSLTWGEVPRGRLVRFREDGPPVQKCVDGVAYRRLGPNGGRRYHVDPDAPIAELIPGTFEAEQAALREARRGRQ